MLESLFFTKKGSNLQNILGFLLRLNNINYTSLYLKKAIENHVESPSMLSVKDILFEYGIDSLAIYKGTYSYSDFEPPFICSIQREDWNQSAFTIVTDNNEGKIKYLEPVSNSIKTIDIADFEIIDKEIVLLLDFENKKDEANYNQNKNIERSQNVIANIPMYALTVVLLASFGLMILGPNVFNWFSLFFLITSTLGLFISLLLVWHEVDAHNPFIKEVCGRQRRKVNCDAVLSSTGATFLGISWVIWGFAYFSTFFFTMILYSQQMSYICLLSILSMTALIYIPFSLYYQYRVIKHWCPLCISVLVLLFVNGIGAAYVLSAKYLIFFSWHTILHFGTIGILFLLLTYYAIPLIKQARESKLYKKKWKRLRYNREIFEILLSKSNKIQVSTEGLGIVIGNPNAHNEIIKVCNPYCGPCSKAHPELEEILKVNHDVKVRVIFTASGNEDDLKTAPVAHLLAVQQKLGERLVHQALDDWYLSEQKDYKIFAEKYPMNDELKEQNEKIYAMRDWCNKMKIRVTPTIYINGHELPDSYQISELKNFF